MIIWKARLVRLAFFAAVIAAVLLPLAGFGNQWGVWSYSFGFLVLQAGLFLAVVGAVLGLVGLVWSLIAQPRDGVWTSAVALIIAVAISAIPGWQLRIALSGQYPPIHDITTDMETPPQFIAVLPLRGADSNPTEYKDKFAPDSPMSGQNAGKHYSEIQSEYYPDIEPVILDGEFSDAFERALTAVEEMGWELVEAAPDKGRIEATATTFWFGFKDDVVIRLLREGEGTRVDIRSTSRVGMGDVGANANRIRAYIAALTE